MAREARAISDSKYEEAARLVEQEKQLLAGAEQQLRDTFSALSAEALKNNTTMFTSQADEKLRRFEIASPWIVLKAELGTSNQEGEPKELRQGLVAWGFSWYGGLVTVWRECPTNRIVGVGGRSDA